MSVVPITLTVRIGTRMSPSAGITQRLITVFTSRWFIAIMIPLPGITPTSSIPAMCRICAAHGAGRVEDETGLDVELLARPLVAHARARHRPVVAVQVHDAVVGEHARALRRGAARQRRCGLPRVDRGVRHRERAPDLRVQPRLAAQRLGHLESPRPGVTRRGSPRGSDRRTPGRRRASRRTARRCPRCSPASAAAGARSRRRTPWPRPDP